MQINPLSVKQTTNTPKPQKVAKFTWRLFSKLALALTASAYLFFTLWLDLKVMRDWPTISYTDCLFYPLRVENIRQKQGIYLIEKAQLEERRGQKLKAKLLYSDGLEKFPADWPSRLQLARLSQADVLSFNVHRLLRDGFVFSSQESSYIDGVVNIAWNMRNYDLVVEACDVGLGIAISKPDQKKRIETLIEQKAYAIIYSGDPLRALATLPTLPSNATAEQGVERATLLLKLQLPIDAIELLKTSLERTPSNLPMLSLLARAQQEIGDIASMEETLAKCIASNPNSPAAWSTVVVTRANSTDLPGARAALEKYFVIFYGNPNHLSFIGQQLASVNDRGLLAECIAESDRLGYPGIDLREFMVELDVRKSDWKKVADLLGEIANRRERFNLRPGSWQQFHESLCDAALDAAPAKQIAFLNLLRREQGTATPYTYECFIKLLGLEGRLGTAKSMALMARRRFPEIRDWLEYAKQFERTSRPLNTVSAK